jgi:hypothetical protein
VDRLVNGAGEPVDEIVLRGVSEESFNQDLYSEFEGHEAALIHYLADILALFCAHVDLSTHEVPGGDVFVTEFFDKLGALGPLARCGPTYMMR